MTSSRDKIESTNRSGEGGEGKPGTQLCFFLLIYVTPDLELRLFYRREREKKSEKVVNGNK